MNIKDLAKKALKDQKESERNAKEESNKKKSGITLRRFHIVFGLPPDRVDGLLAFKDGLTFVLDEGNKWFHLLGTCPRCEEEVRSMNLYNICSLGMQLEEFTPTYHDCPAWRNKINAERNLIRERIEHIRDRLEFHEVDYMTSALLLLSYQLELIGMEGMPTYSVDG